MVQQLKGAVGATCQLWGGVGPGHPWHRKERISSKALSGLGYRNRMPGVASALELRAPTAVRQLLADHALAFPGAPLNKPLRLPGDAAKRRCLDHPPRVPLTSLSVLPPPEFVPLEGCVACGFVPLVSR